MSVERASDDQCMALASDSDNGPLEFGKTLLQICEKRNEAGVQHRGLGVAFRDLRVEGSITGSSCYQDTFSSIFNPSRILNVLQMLRHSPSKTIIKNMEGVVRPGEMLLVLGKPGSGCTTFLKTIANHRRGYLSVSGTVHYGPFSPLEIEHHFRGDVQYCPEEDIHFPTLTLEQTLAFASEARAPRNHLHETKKGHIDSMTNMLIDVFGLGHARKTLVGDAAVHGLSGGEKKRVSIAEILAMRSCVGVWDNPTRGLDSSTALDFLRALRIATDTLKLTTTVCLYQAGESLYENFDKTCVINEGQMAYFGPASQARQYFFDMGYEPRPSQTTADFLVTVTDSKSRIPRPALCGANPTFSTPRTADEFVAYFNKSRLAQVNRDDVDSYINEFAGKSEGRFAYTRSARAEKARFLFPGSSYTINIAMQAKAVMLRRVYILKGDALVVGVNFFAFVFESIIIGSAFIHTPETTSAFFSRESVINALVLFTSFMCMAEIPSLYAQRPIVQRHHRAALHHPFIEALSLTIVDMPIAFLTTFIFGTIVYFMVGLQQTASQFFIFHLSLFAVPFTTKLWFRMIAAAFASEAMATTCAGASMGVWLIYTGYMIPKPSMIGALRWITHINPLQHCFEALTTNEFRTIQGSCSLLIPQGPGYGAVSVSNQGCLSVGSVPGQSVVDGDRYAAIKYGFSYSHIWKVSIHIMGYVPHNYRGQNLGITAAMATVFLIALLAFAEWHISMSNKISTVLFKHGAVLTTASGTGDDEESNQPDIIAPPPLEGESKELEREKHTGPIGAGNAISFLHINYVVPLRGGGECQLLTDISGVLETGKLTALMGESGAGKTTLLNVLAQRMNIGTMTGNILVNGQVAPPDFRSQTGYCQQMDVHLPSATVREALLFSAKLRQPRSVPMAEKLVYVQECLDMCGLGAYADAIVGSLPTEYRKRVTIAVELAAKPDLVLFLDEPTSGLDSQSAWDIITLLRNLADQGQTILCTIHQPSAELFQVFDRVLLLQKGGRTTYFGDLGHGAQTLINYFENNGSRSFLPGENPAEFMLSVTGAGTNGTSRQDWNQIWLDSRECKSFHRDFDGRDPEIRDHKVRATKLTEFATPWMSQVIDLVKRNARAYWRDPAYLVAKLVLNIVGGLFGGFTLYKAADTQQGTQNKLFAIFALICIGVPLAQQLQVPLIATRRIYELRERPSRMYSWTALITSQLLVEIPWNILGSNLLFFCWYWTVGFDTTRAGYAYLMLTIMFPLYYTTIAHATAALSPTPEVAGLLVTLCLSIIIIFAGVIQPFRQLGWWTWLYHLSPFTYVTEGLFSHLEGHKELHCSPVEFVTINPPTGQTCGRYMANFILFVGGYLTNPNASSACQFCVTKSSDLVIETYFNIFPGNRWRDLLLMAVYTAFNVCCIFLFTYLFRIRASNPFAFLWRRT